MKFPEEIFWMEIRLPKLSYRPKMVFRRREKIGGYGKIMLIVSPGDGRREQNVPFRQMDPLDLSMAGRKPQRQLFLLLL